MNVTDNRGQSRFEIEVEGEVAGFATYQRGKGVIAFMHTEVGDEYEGQGIAGRLVSAALNQAREEDLDVLPYCPYVRSYIKEHADYIDLVPEDRRDEFDL